MLVPDTVNDCGLPRPSLVMVTTSLKRPTVGGAKESVMVHCPPGWSVAKQDVVPGKWVTSLPVTFEIVTEVPPTFVTVRILDALCEPTTWLANVTDEGSWSCPDAMPVPDTTNDCGLP